MIARTQPDCALSAPTASKMSPRSSVELGHGRGSPRVVDATYLGELFSASLNGPPLSFQVLSRLVSPPPEEPSCQATPGRHPLAHRLARGVVRRNGPVAPAAQREPASKCGTARPAGHDGAAHH